MLFRDIKRIIKYSLIVIPILVIVVIVSLNIRQRLYGRYTGFSETGTVMLTSDDTTLYNDNELLYLCTDNGATAYNGYGKPVRALAFGLENPTVVSCGSMCAIADIGGKNVYVVPENDITVSYETDYPIVKVRVAENGTSAVLLDNNDFDVIRIYNPKGECAVEIGTKTADEGFPVDIALSADGKKLATFYVSFTGDNVVSKVTFYNTGDVGKNYIDNIVGQKIFEDRMVYSVKFMGNDHIGVILEDGFMIFAMSEIPTEICSKIFDKEETVTDIVMSDSDIITVLDKAGRKSLYFYDFSGKVTGTIGGIPEYRSIEAHNGEAILVGQNLAYIFRKNGTVKFKCTFDGSVENMFFGGKNRYFIIESGRVRAITLEK